MHRVIKNPHHPAHQSIINEAFGPNPNLKKIGENVEQLRHGKISIEHLHHGNLGKGVYADTSERHRTVRLGSDFHWHHQNDESRAGTLIHEAAHALFDAHDHFSKGPNSKGLTTSEAHRAGREKLTGCMLLIDVLLSAQYLMFVKRYTLPRLRDAQEGSFTSHALKRRFL
jgi:hypothetical protein